MLMGAVVVAHDVQLDGRMGGGDLLEEREEFLVAVPRVAGIGGDLPGGHLQGGEQGGGAVPLVVMGAALGQAGAQRQHRRGPVQGLDLALLIDADHDGVVRRRQVQARPRRGSSPPARVGAELEGLDPVRLQAPLAPDPGHRRERDAQLRGQEPGRPVRDPQPRRRPAVIGQGRDHDLDLVDLLPAGRCAARRPAPAMPPRSYRSRQPITVGRDTPTVRAISAFGIPSAASSTIRARFARPDGTLGSRASSASRSRSPSRSTRAGAKDMLHCPAHPDRKTTYNTRH